MAALDCWGVVRAGERYGPACRVIRSQETPVVLFPAEWDLRAEFGLPKDVLWEMDVRSDYGPQHTGSSIIFPAHDPALLTKCSTPEGEIAKLQ